MITSTANNVIKEIRKLHSKKFRSAKKQFLAEGLRTCKTLLDGGIKPVTIFLTHAHGKLTKTVFKGVKVLFVGDTVMKSISQATTPSGIVCQFEIPTLPSIQKLSSGIVCAQISDPGNLGTLIRTAAACNKKTVVIIDSADPWSYKVIQSSAGTIAFTNIFTMEWTELIKNKGGLRLCALTVSDGKPANKKNLENSLLVIGNEAHGIPSQWLKNCNENITLKMPGKTESLNAAIAGSIALYLSI